MSLLLTLSDDPLQLIAAFLSPRDVVNFLRCSRSLYNRFNRSDLFWARLLREQFPDKCIKAIESILINPKEAFLIQAGARDLSKVKWIRLQERKPWPSDREGHICARIGNTIAITGGFVDDDKIYIYDLSRANAKKSFTSITPSVEELLDASPSSSTRLAQERAFQPSSSPFFVYGASFTVLDSNRAVRFGGFRSGGYSAETSQVVVLKLKGNTASWQVVSCKLQSGGNPMDLNWLTRVSRAYHTATLLYDRYLLILGGMQGSESIWEPMILDTHTWTWLDQDIPPIISTQPHPSSRHGHSVIVDQSRNRIVLFGGGDGSDLLRSGKDNTEVWECPLPEHEHQLGRNIATMWNCLHRDQLEHMIGEASGRHQGSMAVDIGNYHERLAPVETLCLSRCHSSFRVSRDRVVLLFGSGRPSTNGVLGYNLAKETFCRPKIAGALPLPRFTCASVYLEEFGYIFVHGGFSSQYGSSIIDSCLLDLSGDSHRTCSIMVENQRARAYPAPTNDDVIKETLLHSSNSRLGARSRSLLQFLQSLAQGVYVESDDDESDDSDYVASR